MDNSPLSSLHRMVREKRDVDCPNTPSCDCESGWSCVLTARTKTTCATVKCVNDKTGNTVANGKSGGGGVNPGIIAGPIVAVLVLVSLGVWWWLRKKKARGLARLAELEARAKRAEQEALSLGLRSPQPTGGLHQRHQSQGGNSGGSLELDPAGFPMTQTRSLTPVTHNPSVAGRTLKVYSTHSINLDPSHPSNRPTSPSGLQRPPDPFSDSASIATSNSFLSQSTNVIPIAYVPGPSYGRPISTPHSAAGGPPSRPLRDPNLDLGIKYGPQHATTKAGVAVPRGAPIDDASSGNSRQSVAPSFLSFNSTNFALDTPTISTVNVGVAQRANVIQLGPGGTRLPPSAFPSSPSNTQPKASDRLTSAKPVAGRSPLSQAANTTGSSEPSSPIPSPVREPHDPFNDTNARASSQPYTVETLAPHSRLSVAETTTSRGDRPYSTASSQSQGSVILGSATIVKVGQEQNNTLFRSGSVRSVGGRKAKLEKGADLEQHPEETDLSDLEPPSGAQERDRSSSGTAFTSHSLGLGSYPFAMPSSTTLPRPPPIGGGNGDGGHRDTQYSLGSFDFIPPAPLPDRQWGHGAGPSNASSAMSHDKTS